MIALCLYGDQKPFFGGRRDCEQNAEADNRPLNEFICFDCSDNKSIKAGNCGVNGHAEYILWKCRCGHCPSALSVLILNLIRSWFALCRVSRAESGSAAIQQVSQLGLLYLAVDSLTVLCLYLA